MRERDAIDNRTTLAKLKGLLIEQEFLTSNSIADHNGSGGNPEFAPRRLTRRLIFEPLSPANQQHPRSSRHPKSKRHHRRFRIYLELFHHVTQSKKIHRAMQPHGAAHKNSYQNSIDQGLAVPCTTFKLPLRHGPQSSDEASESSTIRGAFGSNLFALERSFRVSLRGSETRKAEANFESPRQSSSRNESTFLFKLGVDHPIIRL